MPYAKKRTYKKKTYARKSRPRKSTLAREVRLIKKTIKPELKFVVPDVAVGAIDNTVNLYPLNVVPQGNTRNTMVGQQILNKSLHLNLHLSRDPATTALFDRVRCMLIWQKQPNGTAITANELWEGGFSYIDQLLSWNDRKTFKVLSDKIYTLSALYPSRRITFRKLLNKTSEFDMTGDQIQTGALFLVLVSDTLAANDPPQLDASDCRLFFTDC